MEINNVSSKAYTSSAASVEEDDELIEEEESQYAVSQTEKNETDKTEFTRSDFDEDDVEEKANNYLQNILFAGNLTPESQAALTEYLNTFDVAQFIKMYGPFSSASEVSAAMYAVTAGLIKHPDNE